MEDAKKPEPTNGNKKKREDKLRRRDVRAVENVLKEINQLPEQQRFEALTAKYSELYEEYRSCHSSLAISEKRCTVLQREKDQLQSEQSKLVLARSRMESLCRELQRQNKLIKEENLAKIREEEERRKEVAAKFQMTLNEVTNMMQENTEKNIKLRDDNLDMATKIESLYEMFEKRKEQQTRMEQQIELERQLAQAQVEKAKLELKAEEELWDQERETLHDKWKKSEENCAQMQKTMQTLQENLELYSGKYQEFKSSINKSNQVFDDCKSEMGKMSKQIVTLEKEVKVWKHRSQRNAQSVLELSANKQAQEQKLDASDKKLDQLQKLCRQLQADRSAYFKLLKSNNIEVPSQTCTEEHTTNSQANNQQPMTKKEKHLEQLKDNLKMLQNKLTSMQYQMAVETLEGTAPAQPCSSQDTPKSENEPVTVCNGTAPTENITESEEAPSVTIEEVVEEASSL